MSNFMSVDFILQNKMAIIFSESGFFKLNYYYLVSQPNPNICNYGVEV